MVVDDDEINILVETSYIKNYGFIDVIVARNGQESIINIKDATSKGKFFDNGWLSGLDRNKIDDGQRIN
jgi:hypothetical protein